MSRQAIVLAGGKGTRLRPYTTAFPKPLVPVGERPILDLVVKQLELHGFTRLTFAVNHLAELIRAYFGNGEKWKVEISYSLEEEPLGTAGPLGIVDEVMPRFLVLNGDILTDLDYSDLWRAHEESGAIATIATCMKHVPIALGVLDLDDQGNLAAYREKPVLNYRVSMGVYVFEARILKFVERNAYLDLPDLMRVLMAAGETVSCYDFRGNWLDIGNPDEYEEANRRIIEDPAAFLKVPQ